MTKEEKFYLDILKEYDIEDNDLDCAVPKGMKCGIDDPRIVYYEIFAQRHNDGDNVNIILTRDEWEDFKKGQFEHYNEAQYL